LVPSLDTYAFLQPDDHVDRPQVGASVDDKFEPDFHDSPNIQIKESQGTATWLASSTLPLERVDIAESTPIFTDRAFS
jgi:hypothetical protein